MYANTSVPSELGTLKIGRLLKMYAVPGIIAQTAASLYNMVDSIYIGHVPGVGSSAISGLAVTFPLMNLAVAIGTLVGVGAMTLVSVLLGQKNYGTSRKVLSNVLSLNLIIGVVFSAVMLLCLDSVLRFFGASDVTLPFARDYMVIILLFNPVTHLYHGFNGLIRTSGHPRTAMGLTLFTVVFNAVLDPALIFGMGLGIRGAAIATVVSQIVALLFSIRFFCDRRNVVHFEKPVFRIDWKIAKQSLSIGLAPFLMNSAACLVSMLINQQLGRYGGDLAIGAYGIINRITMLFLMVCMGFNQGLQPISGYNFGARLYSRVREVFILTVKWETGVMAVCFIISMFFPEAAVSLFTNDPEMIRIASHGMTVMNAAIAFVGYGVVSGNMFQSLGMVRKSIILSLSRQIIVLVPLIYLLPDFLGEKGVWLSFPISDFVSVTIAAFMISDLFRKLNKLSDGEDSAILGSSIN